MSIMNAFLYQKHKQNHFCLNRGKHLRMLAELFLFFCRGGLTPEAKRILEKRAEGEAGWIKKEPGMDPGSLLWALLFAVRGNFEMGRRSKNHEAGERRPRRRTKVR